MITGHRPFRGEHEAAITYSLMNETPEPLARYKADVPNELQRVIDKSLAKEKADRYQHIDEMLVDLRKAQQESPSAGIIEKEGKKAPTVDRGRDRICCPRYSRLLLPSAEACSAR